MITAKSALKSPHILTSDNLPDKDTMQKALETAQHRGYIKDNEVTYQGFIVPEITGELLTPLEGMNGYIFIYRRDIRTADTTIVRERLKARLKELEKIEQRKIRGDDRLAVKDAVTADVALEAQPKTSFIMGVVCLDHGKFIINGGNEKGKDALISLIINRLGSLELKTLFVSGVRQGLTARLKAYLDIELEEQPCFDELEPFSGWQLNSNLTLARTIDKKKQTVRLTGGASDNASFLRESLTSGDFSVNSIRLADGFEGSETVSFNLTDEFRISSIGYPKPEKEKPVMYLDAESGEVNTAEKDKTQDPAFYWRNEISVRYFFIHKIVEQLLKMFGSNNAKDSNDDNDSA